MAFTSLVVDGTALVENLAVLALMAVRWRNVPDGAVQVAIVIPMHKSGHPVTGLINGFESPFSVA